MTCIGLVGSGAMGAALGGGWLESGARVVTAVHGRSERTRSIAQNAGLETVDRLDDMLRDCDVLIAVVPPGAAMQVARDIAAGATRTGSRPLVVDLNAIAPSSVIAIAGVLGEAGCDLVDGSISGGPPRSGEQVRVYLCGPRADEVAAIPNARLDIVGLGGNLGSASALKMCTASMYKGTKALVMQALLTAEAHGVREEFLVDTMREWPEHVPSWHTDVALAASKAWRFVDEMEEIARTQRDAGLAGELFAGVAAAYRRAADTSLGHTAPEDVDRRASVSDVLAGLRIDT